MLELLDELESLLNQKIVQDFKISRGFGSGLANNVSGKRNESSSLVAQEVIYGRDEDKESILKWLTSESNNHNHLSILSIVGMGGMVRPHLLNMYTMTLRLRKLNLTLKLASVFQMNFTF